VQNHSTPNTKCSSNGNRDSKEKKSTYVAIFITFLFLQSIAAVSVQPQIKEMEKKIEFRSIKRNQSIEFECAQGD
jgi:hypothetical protein